MYNLHMDVKLNVKIQKLETYIWILKNRIITFNSH